MLDVVLAATPSKPNLTGLARLDTLLSLLNAGLLLALLLIFFKQWRQTRAAFSLGLVLFAAVFLVKEVLGVAQTMARATGATATATRLDVAVALFETIALAILLYNVAK